jgi:predicted AlkP superfamily pyrophosphatase or phosphodiesterase
MNRINRISLFPLAAVLVCAAPPEAVPKPKLVLAIVVDQFRYDYTMRFRDDYHAGLAKLLDRGAVFTDAHHRHSTTVTAVGHSTFLSGAPPSASGIIANEWFDRETGKTVTSVSDPKTKLIGGVPGQPGSSPRRLEVSTVVDELKIQGGESHAIGVSIKDRGAILPAGHMADAAYWYDPDSNNWVTSSFYTSDLPTWVQAVNAKHGYQRALGATWFPVDDKDGSGKPFCTMVAGSETRFCGGLEATPWGNELIEEFAEGALDGEKLGRHSGVDVLTVSFSSNDYVGHAVGPDDPAVRDMAIRTDRLLGKLLDYVDQRVGAGNTLVVLTADHGVAPVPEVNEKRSMPGGRLSDMDVMKAMTVALVKRYGPGNWFTGGTVTMPYLNWELIRTKKLDLAEVESVAAEAARMVAHIARVYTRQQLLSGTVQRDPIGDSMSLSFFAPRFGDLIILPEPYYLFDATGTTHGTPYDYDTHVPLIFYGPGIKPGTYKTRVAVNDVAPTLAEILHVERPSGSIGRVLSEILQ